jgi:hypothetical protein
MLIEYIFFIISFHRFKDGCFQMKIRQSHLRLHSSHPLQAIGDILGKTLDMLLYK